LETIVVTFASDREISFVFQSFLHGTTLSESYAHLHFMGVSPAFRKLLVNKHFGTPSACPRPALGLDDAAHPLKPPVAGFLCIEWQHNVTANASIGL
jgi:hypothetical protein